jgi:MFS family permease
MKIFSKGNNMPKRYIIEAVLFLTYVVFGLFWVGGMMMSKAIIADFSQEGLFAAAWGTHAITIAKIGGNLVAAWVFLRLKPKKAFALAIILIGCGALGVLAGTYTIYVFTRILVGFGGALAVVFFNPIVLHYFNPSERPIINGLNQISFNTGNLIALLCITSFLTWLQSWQNVLIFFAVLLVPLFILWLIVSDDFSLNKPKTQEGPAEEKPYKFSDGLKEKFNWFYPLTYYGGVFLYVAVFSFFPLLPGFAIPAQYLSAMIIGAGTVGTFIGMAVAKKYPMRVPVIRWSGVGMTGFGLVLVLTGNPHIAAASAFLCGLFMFLPGAAIFTLPQELPGMTPAKLAITFSIMWTTTYVIVTILNLAASYIADATGDRLTACLFMVACSASYFVFSFFLPETGKRKTE